MSRTIYKYDISIVDEFNLDLPTGAEILSIQMQSGQFRMWAIVDPIREGEVRKFIVRGTGHPLPNRAIKHIATIQDGIFVWHFFEVLKPL